MLLRTVTSTLPLPALRAPARMPNCFWVIVLLSMPTTMDRVESTTASTPMPALLVMLLVIMLLSTVPVIEAELFEAMLTPLLPRLLMPGRSLFETLKVVVEVPEPERLIARLPLRKLLPVI